MKKPDAEILKQHGWRFIPARQCGRQWLDEFFHHTETKTTLPTYDEVLDWIITHNISK